MATSVRSSSSSRSPSIGSSLMLEDGLHIAEGHKFSRKNFKATVSTVKKNTFAFIELNQVFHDLIKKGNAVVVRSSDHIPFGTQTAKEVKKFAETGKIVINPDGKSFRLAQDFMIDSHALKLQKDYVSRGFEIIEAAAKVGSKRSTVNNSGAVLTDEGYAFLVNAYINGGVNDNDLARYAQAAGIKEERRADFFNLYNTFIAALGLSLTPQYGDDQLNNTMRAILNNTLSSRLLHFYKSLKFAKSEDGKYTPDALMLSLTQAYSMAVANSDAKRLEYSNKVGLNNYARFSALLEQYLKPVFDQNELADINYQRNKTAKEARRKQYIAAKRQNILAELRRYDPTLTDRTAQSLAKKLSNLTTVDTFTSQTFMTLSHAILNPKGTNDAFKADKNTDVEKARKVLLKKYLHDYEVHFIDYSQTDPVVIRDAAYNLINAGEYAVAAKFVNAYINAVMGFIKDFIIKNNTKVVKTKTAKTDLTSIASIMN